MSNAKVANGSRKSILLYNKSGILNLETYLLLNIKFYLFCSSPNTRIVTQGVERPVY